MTTREKSKILLSHLSSVVFAICMSHIKITNRMHMHHFSNRIEINKNERTDEWMDERMAQYKNDNRVIFGQCTRQHMNCAVLLSDCNRNKNNFSFVIELIGPSVAWALVPLVYMSTCRNGNENE